MVQRSRAVLALASASIVAGCGLLVSAPAVAATLPAGQTITTVDVDATAFRANPNDGVLTVIGATHVADLLAIDVDDTGHGYAIMGDTDLGDGDDFVQSVLYRFDAATGIASDPVSIVVDGGHGIAWSCQGVDYTAGVIVAGCRYIAPGGEQYVVVGVLDPATGGLSPDVLTTEQDPLLALAKSPIDGTIWVITLGGTLLNADLAAHTYTPVHPLQGFPIVYGADFDRDGQLFVTYKAFDDGDFQWRLGTLDTATATATEIGPLTGNVDTEAITVWGKAALGGEEPPGPALPATGPDLGPGLLLGALGLLGLGAAALFTVRLKGGPA